MLVKILLETRGTKGLPIIRIQDLTGNAYDLGFYDGEYLSKIEINIAHDMLATTMLEDCERRYTNTMSEERKQINYTVACVSEFACKHNLKVKEAFRFLYEYKAIEFLKENYDIEHTLSLEDALEDMLIICEKNGGVLV